MRSIQLAIVWAFIVMGCIQAHAEAGNPEADKAWEAMPKFECEGSDETDFTCIKGREQYLRKYVDAGYEFWKKFPKDERRYIWLRSIMSFSQPSFWLNIDEGARAKANAKDNQGFHSAAVDWKLYKKWQQRLHEMDKDLKQIGRGKEDLKKIIEGSELQRELLLARNAAFRADKVAFIARVAKAFESSVNYNKTQGTFTVSRWIDNFFFNFHYFGLEMNDLKKFAASFGKSKYAEMREWACKKMNIFALMNEPFQLRQEDLEGNIVDLGKLRGKVVLVDFWSNTCTICINRMPHIKTVYEKYRDKGFVVVSAAINPLIDKEKILKIHERIGADWPVILLGGDSKEPGKVAPNSIASKHTEKFGFTFVPQLFLLDREGKLVSYNGELMLGDMEPLIKKTLGL